MTELLELSEEQAAVAVLERRARAALNRAADVVSWARANMVGVERGETFAPAATPVRISAVDAADDVYARLNTWVEEWARILGLDLPVHVGRAKRAWRRDGEPIGLPAGVDVVRAHTLTSITALWLNNQHWRIMGHTLAPEYLADVADAVWAVAARYPTAPRPDPETTPRTCPDCGADSVVGELFGESLTAAERRGEPLLDLAKHINVACKLCNFRVEPRATKIIGWLS